MRTNKELVNVLVRAPADIGRILRRIAWEHRVSLDRVLLKALLYREGIRSSLADGYRVIIANAEGVPLADLDLRVNAEPASFPDRLLTLPVAPKTHALLVTLMESQSLEQGALVWRAVHLLNYVLGEQIKERQVLLLNQWNSIEGMIPLSFH